MIWITNNKDLKTIDENAFKSSEKIIVFMWDNPELIFERSVFDILKKFTKLSEVRVGGAHINTIPTNALVQPSIIRISFLGESYKTIEDNAF